MRILLAISFLMLNACVEPSTTRGVCQVLEVCVLNDPNCEEVTIWFECRPEIQEECFFQRLDQTLGVPNSETVPCEQCDINQCPEGTFD